MADDDDRIERGPKYYYHPVPGSRELGVSSLNDDAVLAAIEEPGEGPEEGEVPRPQREFRGEFLGGALVKSEYVRIPRSVLDDPSSSRTPLEQALYVYLVGRSFGQARNFCRVGKRELMGAVNLSERRLLAALDGLVRRGYIKPLHRNPRGTLYRVFLPEEIKGEPEGIKGERDIPGVEFGPVISGAVVEDYKKIKTGSPYSVKKQQSTLNVDYKKAEQVQSGKKEKQAARQTAQTPPIQETSPVRERPVESPLNEERFQDLRPPDSLAGLSINDLVRRFFDPRRIHRPAARDLELSTTVVMDLLEEGYTRQQIAQAIGWFVINVPEAKNLEKLPYFIEKALLDNRDQDRGQA